MIFLKLKFKQKGLLHPYIVEVIFIEKMDIVNFYINLISRNSIFEEIIICRFERELHMFQIKMNMLRNLSN